MNLEKKDKLMEKLTPLLKMFEITDYEYIMLDNPYFEILRIADIYINVSANSVEATINEALACLILRSDPNYKGVGNEMKLSWMSKNTVDVLMGVQKKTIDHSGQ